jgi:hypothetical protein
MYLSRQILLLAGWFALIATNGFADEALDPSSARLKKDIYFLASDECEGRGVTTKGIHIAADYIAAEFKKAGLIPPAGQKDYFQPFTIKGQAKLGEVNTLRFIGPDGNVRELKLGKDFTVTGLSSAGKLNAPVVFVGFGISAPDQQFDEYAGLDVAGKVVVVLRQVPRANDKKNPFPNAEKYAPLIEKLAAAEKRKAAAIIFVNDQDKAGKTDDLINFNLLVGAGAGDIPALHIKRAVLSDLLQSTEQVSLDEIEKQINEQNKPQSRELKGIKAELEVNITRADVAAKNVIGVLEGNGPLANETVVIGAHYDHLGYGERGSLAKLKEKAIHNGADDNASGTTALLELARRFAAIKDRQGRRIVFMAFSGEELGLLGSRHYTKNPLYKLEDTVAMLNLDMVGRLSRDEKTGKDKLQVLGVGSSKSFEPLVTKLNEKYDFQLKIIRNMSDGAGGSDHQSFYNAKVPVIFLFTGLHPQYHRPTDKADLINIAGLKKVTDFAEEIGMSLTLMSPRPALEKVSTVAGGTPTKIPRIGVAFDYGDESKKGALVEMVSEGGPAAKAGIKSGDYIVEVDGRPVRDLTSYMSAIGAAKRGQPIDMVVDRSGKRINLKVQPE